VEFPFEFRHFLRGRGSGDDVINMNCKDSSAQREGLSVDTPFIAHTMETPPDNSVVKHLIPDAAGLFHAVYALGELHHPVRFTWLLEPRWLFYVGNLFRR